MAHPVCLVTGCTLFVVNEEKSVRGDLHMVGKTYVFNAAGGEKMAWAWKGRSDDVPTISTNSNNFLEKRGVIVFDKNDSSMNEKMIARMP